MAGRVEGGVLDRQVNALTDLIKSVQVSQDEFKAKADKALQKADASLHEAGRHGLNSVGAAADAGYIAGQSAVQLGKGIGHYAGGVVYDAAGVVFGVRDLAVDLGTEAVHHSAKGSAKFFTALGNLGTELGGGVRKAVVETGVGTPDVYLSEKLFEAAAAHYKAGGPHMKSFAEKAGQAGALAGVSAIEVGKAAWDLGETICHGSFAAAQMGVVGAQEACEWGLRAARVSVKLADRGAEAAAQGCYHAAEISARIASATADDSDKKIVISDATKKAIEKLEKMAG